MNRQMQAALEVLAVAAAYIVISTGAVKAIDFSSLFPVSWSVDERATGSGFAVGALVQFTLVLAGAYFLGIGDLRKATAACLAQSTRKAWTIAAIATAIHISTALLLFVPQPDRVLEPSGLNLILSTVPAADGWSQEVLFRGYVLLRLARAGVPGITQVLLSGGLFAAIHLGYTGQTLLAFVAPLIGTFMLGCFYAWRCRVGAAA